MKISALLWMNKYGVLTAALCCGAVSLTPYPQKQKWQLQQSHYLLFYRVGFGQTKTTEPRSPSCFLLAAHRSLVIVVVLSSRLILCD